MKGKNIMMKTRITLHELQKLKFEPSRAVKDKWWGLPRTWRQHGHLNNPGACPVPRRSNLLGTGAGIGLDVVASLWLCLQTAAQFATALGTGAIEVFGGWLRDIGAPDANRRDCHIAVAETDTQKAALREQRPRRYAVAQLFGAGLILLGCAFKLVSIVGLGAFSLIGGQSLAIASLYLAAAVLAFKCPGPGFAEWRFYRALRRELRDYLNSEDRDRHPNRIREFREASFETGEPLQSASADSTTVEASTKPLPSGKFSNKIRSWGLLTDAQVDSLVAQQQTPIQKTLLSDHATRHQLEIMQSDPRAPELMPKATLLPPITTPAPPTGTTSGRPVRVAAVIVAPLCLIWSLTGCVKTQAPVGFDLAVATAIPLADRPDAFFSPPFLDILVPFQSFSEPIFPATTTITRLDLPNEIHRFDTTTAPEDWHDFVTKFWGARGASVALEKVKRYVSTLRAGDLAKPATPSSDLAERAATWVAERVSEGATVLAYQPGNDKIRSRESITLKDGHVIPLYASKESLGAAIENEVTRSGKRAIGVLYNIPGSSSLPTEPVSESDKRANSESGKASAATTGPAPSTNPLHLNAAPIDLFAFFSSETDRNKLKVDEAGRVYFDKDSAVINETGQRELRNLADRLRNLVTDPRVHVIVTGRADPRGSEQVNYRLSEQRVNAVVAALARFGIVVSQTIPAGKSSSPTGHLSKGDFAPLRDVIIVIEYPEDLKSQGTNVIGRDAVEP